jgi:hypothetical protein
VSADGRTLMFTSHGDVTGYDNNGTPNNCSESESGTHQGPCNEVYVYDATTARVTCISCNPKGTPATRPALLYHLEDLSFEAPPRLLPQDLPRNLSQDGSKVFFETEEGLLPQDTNGVMDVYEWEREGSGSCASGSAGGCLYLISSGQSREPSYFAEAGASGRDVFFFTRQPLVTQDGDEIIDVYDAREGGGIAAQNATASVAPCVGEACRAAQSAPPPPGVPVSQVFSGPGNPSPEPAVPPATVAKPKPLTRAQLLAKALRLCRKKYKRPGKRRATCEHQSKRAYAAARKAGQSTRPKVAK